MAVEELQKNFDYMNTKRYQSNVLIGNWFEDRFYALIDPHAIVPIFPGKTTCLHTPSEYRNSYQQLPRSVYGHMFTATKCEAFANQLKTRRTNLTMFDDNRFLDNFSTSSDISYRILPQRALQKDPLSRHTNTAELLEPYGNVTNFGLQEYKQRQQQVDQFRYCTNYNDAYTPKLQQLRKKQKSLSCQPERDYRRKLYT